MGAAVEVMNFGRLERKLDALGGLGRLVAIQVIGETALDINSAAKKYFGDKENAPQVDTGVTRAGIITMFTPDHLTAEVGSNSKNALRIHEGTGIFGNGQGAGVRFFPPPDALAGWAQRHGMPTDASTLFLLARAIYKKGGQHPNKFLQRAAEDNQGKFFERMARVLHIGVGEIKRMA